MSQATPSLTAPSEKEVLLQTHGQDKYGRTLGDVFLLDGTNVNHALVKDGWCWWYRKYAPGDTVLEGLEKGHERRRKGCGLIPSQCRRGVAEGVGQLQTLLTRGVREGPKPELWRTC